MTAAYSTCAMELPSKYVMMEAEEMTYLEGGGKITISLSRDFLRDCVTASLSAICTIVCTGIGMAIAGPAGGALASKLGPVVGGALGAAIGWIIGGSISRTRITSGVKFSVDVPFLPSKSIYIG